MHVLAKRLLDHPIINQALDPSLGDNINGPSLIKAPEWLPDPKARYYLYFSHHEGKHIRLAFADALEGPWRIHCPGAVHLEQTPFPVSTPDVPQPAWAIARGVNGLYPHIASPDVHVDPENRHLRMYFHGLDHDGEQRSLVAVSHDGINWGVEQERIAQVYLRVFEYCGMIYALALGGQILRKSSDGAFETGPWPFPDGHRHSAVLVRGDTLHVFWTGIGDAPEHILHSTINLKGHWKNWQVEHTAPLLQPEMDWEGANQPILPSRTGAAEGLEHALRDPCIFEQNGRVYMIYVGGGENALGLAEVIWI
ncbi:MAG: hypothetical protein AAGA76_13065 [Pseudomonadota bacterium]